MNIHLAVGVRKYIFFCCKFHIDFFTQCYFFFFFIFFFLQYVTNTLETAPRRIVFLLSRFLSLISHSYLVILQMKRYTSFSNRDRRKSLRVSRSYRFLFFSSFCLFFKYFASRVRWPAFSAIFSVFFFCLFVSFVFI